MEIELDQEFQVLSCFNQDRIEHIFFLLCTEEERKTCLDSVSSDLIPSSLSIETRSDVPENKEFWYTLEKTCLRTLLAQKIQHLPAELSKCFDVATRFEDTDQPRAFRLFYLGALLQDPMCQYAMANYYHEQYDLKYIWAKRSAQQNCISGILSVANCCQIQKKEEEFRYWKEVADSQLTNVQDGSLFYERAKIEDERNNNWMRKSAELNYIKAIAFFIDYYFGNDQKQCDDCLQKVLSKYPNEPDFLNMKGRYIDSYERNVHHAMVWYQKAAELNYSHAQYNLALCFKHLKVYEMALYWSTKAVDHGDVEAIELRDEMKKHLETNK